MVQVQGLGFAQNAQMLKCSNAQNAQMLKCSKCSNAQNAQMLKLDHRELKNSLEKFMWVGGGWWVGVPMITETTDFIEIKFQ